MIDTLYFGIGFIIYITFNILTFNVYSRTPGITKKFILFGIFVFYSSLAIYVINFVEGYLGGNFFEILIQVLIFLIAGGLFLNFKYGDIIKNEEMTSTLEKNLEDEL